MRSCSWPIPIVTSLVAGARAAALSCILISLALASDSSMSGVDDTTVSYPESAVVVAPNLTLSSGDDIDGACVIIGSGFNDGGTDELDITSTPGGISASYNGGTGILTLVGTTTPANYQAALRTVTFTTSATNPGTSRRIAFSLGTVLFNPANRHYYRFVEDANIEWVDAYADAGTSTYYGRTGYLATITSGLENNLVFDLAGVEGWIGASDHESYNGGDGEGQWEWVTGPESGTQFYWGDQYGNAVNGAYENWNWDEPNDADGEDYAHFFANGTWNDVSDNSVEGYYLEYGGMDGDSPVTINGTVTVRLAGMIALRNVHKKNQSDQLCSVPDIAIGALEVVGNLGSSHTATKAMAALRGGGGDDRVFAAEKGQLLEIDPQTGDAAVVGSIGWQDVTGLAFHPVTDILYGITYGSNKLLTIDIDTGAGTVVASRVLNSSRLNDLAFHPHGDLYVVTADSPSRLFRIHASTGKKIERWNLTGASGLESILWSEDGETLYSAAVRNNFKDLCTIDIETSLVSFVSQTSSAMRDIEGLAWFGGTLGSSKPTLLADDGPEDITDPDEFLDAGENNAFEGEGEDVVARAPARLALLGNVPNPFNPSTRIEYEMPVAGPLQLDIYDVAGRHVVALARGHVEAGRHAVMWNGRTAGGLPAASGVYFVRLRHDTEIQTRAIILLE